LQWWWYTTKYKLPRFFSTVCIGLRKSLGRKERNMTGIMALEDALMQLVREVGKERVHEVNNKQNIFLPGYSCMFPSRSVRITMEVQVKSACNLTQF
jgi:hypothetical protein